MLSLTLLLVSVALSIKIPAVQTWVVGKITHYLSNQWGTKASVGAVDIVFFDSIELKDVFIGDQNQDTLIQTKKIQASISIFSLSESKLIFKTLRIEDGVLKITKSKSDRTYNLDFIIDYFSSTSTDTMREGFEFNPGEVQLANMSIIYRDYKWNDKASGIDFDDLRLDHTFLKVSDLNTSNHTTSAKVNQLSFREKSGFAVDQLSAILTAETGKISFTELQVRTAKTNLTGRFSMEYAEPEDFQDFITKVMMDAELNESKLNSSDLAYFASELKGSDMTIGINGKIKGTVDNLKGRNLQITYGQSTILEGNAFISGLPNIDETYFDIKVDKLETVYADLSSLPKIPSEKPANIDIPRNIEKLGTIRISGKFNGFLSDFVSYANFNTSAGFFSTDVNFKVNNGIKDASYSGHVAANELDLGLIFNLKGILDKTSFKADLVGTGLEQQYLKAKLEGQFSKVIAYGYGYQGIAINGEFKQSTFEGLVSVKDPNLEMDFSGMINLKSNNPSYVFNIDVDHSKPSILGWMPRDSSASLSFSADISMEGDEVENITGTGLLNKIKYSENGLALELDDLTISADNNPDRDGLISIESDILDAELTGKYSRLKILESAYELLAYYLPIIKQESGKKTEPVMANFDLKLKSVNNLLDIFYPELQISDGTSITGKLNSSTKDLEVALRSDSIRYDMALFRGVDMVIDNEQKNINFTNRFKDIVINDTLIFINPVISGNTDKQLTKLSLSSDSRDSSINDLSMNAEATYDENGATNITVLNSNIVLNGKNWKVSAGNNIRLKDNSAEIFNLGISNELEQVVLNGILSKSTNDKLLLKFDHFQTSILNPLLAVYDFGMSGVATGSAEISSLLSKPGISADLSLKELAIYQDTLGDAEIKLDFNAEKKEIDLMASVDRGGLKSIGVSGTYFIDEPEDRMDFKISLQKTNLAAFARYAEGIISDVRGKASGELSITGNFKKPLLTGKLRLQQTSFLFDYLNIRYSLSDEIEFTDRFFRFNNITVNDENGNQAKVDGYVYHKNLSDFNLKFDVSTNNLQVLNTSSKQNELYYGKGFASGKVKVYGPLDLIHISLALKTEKNTAIFIPLSNPEEVTQSGFINFIQKELENTVEKKATNEFTGIELDFELAVTSDAEVQLIFDSKIGDIIKGRGNGNLRMSVNRLGDFKMYGDFQTESGDYLFTLQNLINKKFIIKPGGTIRWTGDPYDAVVDIQGVYKLRTSLYDLIRDSTLTQRLPVEVHLKLKDKLFNPALEFDVIIPDIDPTAQTLLNRYISTEQEKSTQTMSLLVLNRFSQANDVETQGTSSSSAIGANAAELLSQQLSVWASQISDAFNLGVNYRAADAFSQEEYEVELSTRLWNDRITIDGNLGLSDNNKNTTSGVVGDFNAEVKVSKDGRFRFKVFNKSINNLLTDYNSPYTQGIGILYRKEFDSFEELFKKSKEILN